MWNHNALANFNFFLNLNRNGNRVGLFLFFVDGVADGYGYAANLLLRYTNGNGTFAILGGHGRLSDLLSTSFLNGGAELNLTSANFVLVAALLNGTSAGFRAALGNVDGAGTGFSAAAVYNHWANLLFNAAPGDGLSTGLRTALGDLDGA